MKNLLKRCSMAVKITLIAFISMYCSLSQASDPDVAVYYAVRPPLIMKEGETLIGSVGLPSARAFADAGISVRFSELPLARQLAALEENTKPVCALNYFRRAEREKIGVFSEAVSYDSPLGVLVLAGNADIQRHQSFSTLIADTNFRLARKIETSYGAYLDGLVASLKPRLTESPEENNIRLAQIEAGRADYMFIQKPEAEYIISTGKFDPSTFKHLTMTDAPPINTRHILCSKSFGTEKLTALNKAILLISPKPAN